MRSFFKKVKRRLMFTGWLQYLPPFVASFFLLLVYFVLRAMSLNVMSDVMLALTVLIAAISLFDLATVKYDIKPMEKLPSRRDGMDAFDLMRARYATRMGLATCWIGPGADQSSIVKRLGEEFDPDADHIICICAIGCKSRYKPIFLRLMQKVQHRRLPLRSLFYTDSHFRDPVDEEKFPFNQFGRCYEACEWAPSSFNSQPTRGVVILDEERDAVVRVDFYAGTDSRYYAPLALGIWCANWETGCQELGISGNFKILSKEQVGADDGVLEYDVSWVEAN